MDSSKKDDARPSTSFALESNDQNSSKKDDARPSTSFALESNDQNSSKKDDARPSTSFALESNDQNSSKKDDARPSTSFALESNDQNSSKKDDARPSTSFALESNDQNSSKKDDARPSTSFALESPQVQGDGAEREERRSIAADPEEIKNHIDICLKMFFENKINIHNAWNMKIIEYMAKYLQLRKDSGETLQLASKSLDAGAKVYSIRVDDVHSTGLKLASDISKIAHTNREEPDNEDDGEIENLNQSKKTGAIKKKRKFVPGGHKHTIVKDVNTLFQDVQKLDSAIFKTKSNSDFSMVDNFLTNRISNDKSGCAFVFMSREKESLWVSQEDTDHTLEDKQYPFKLPGNKFDFCREFQSFKVDDSDSDNEEGGTSSIYDTELVLDDEGIPMAALDGPIDDVFNDNNSDQTDLDDEAAGSGEVTFMKEVTKVVDLRPSTSTEPDDYCFKSIASFSKCNIFMGPSHWKYKYLKPAASRFSGKDDKKVAKRKKPKKKEPVEIDFFNGTPPVTLESPSNRVRTTLKPWPVTNRYTYRKSEFITKAWNVMNLLFLKPTELRGAENHPSGSNNDELVPNDSIYCNQNNDYDDQNTDDIARAEELPTLGQIQKYAGENLIDLPEMVEINFLNYATKSKKIDMKKLKEKVWSIMIDEADSNLSAEELFQKKMEKPVTFRDIYETLPSKLNRSMKKDLSRPLVFIAILHLANEKNLKLTSQADLTNFLIEQDNDDLE